ncbi:DNA-3-methyladenine glycosylase family protein [Frigidibacter oleivorans]|uniref:DNA-3-methyladenine glycosylase family protein n=1 Tax=Frigidibacter oleivorans TaxID=2487129 RepID=UPI000F8F403D|nr:DNA-3-methyladenine glycosylase [Frigidibacter oleivorans]
MRRIVGADCLAEGAAHLLAVEPRFAPALLAPLPLRLRPAGFAELAAVVVGQQVSTASAAAILGRMAAAGLLDPATVRAAGDDALRGAGLSRQKIATLRALAASGLDLATLDGLDDAGAVAALTALPGIGRWTAEVYLTFSLGRPDVMPAGDLALQEAARLLFALPDRPREPALRRLAEPWAPWRAVAARALWAYYRLAKGREGMT